MNTDKSRNVSLLNSVFASDAQTVVPPSPAVGIPYRNPNLTSGKAAQGWPFSIVVDSADFNELMFRVTSFMDFVEKTGGILWSPLTDYPIGAFVRDDNFIFWEATIASGPNNGGSQVPEDGSQYWKVVEIVQTSTNNGGRAIGEYFAYPSAVPPEGAYLLNGQTIANCSTLYPDFWAWLTDNAGNILALTNEAYEYTLSRTGVCGGFVINSAAGSVRLPDLRNGTLWGADSTTIGQSLAAGLPNIVGVISPDDTSGTKSQTAYEDGFTAQGAFSNSTTVRKLWGGDGTDARDFLGDLVFDASLSNPIYGNSDTVQPPAVRVSWCIQVFNAATALSEIQMKAQTDLANVDSNIDFIVEHGEGTGEAGGVLAWWWYDKYRSGKVVQGGKTALQTQAGYYTINLPVEMYSADYIITMAYDGGDGALITGGTYDATTASNISATSFDTYLRITNNVKYKFWRVEGKAATE